MSTAARQVATSVTGPSQDVTVFGSAYQWIFYLIHLRPRANTSEAKTIFVRTVPALLDADSPDPSTTTPSLHCAISMQSGLICKASSNYYNITYNFFELSCRYSCHEGCSDSWLTPAFSFLAKPSRMKTDTAFCKHHNTTHQILPNEEWKEKKGSSNQSSTMRWTLGNSLWKSFKYKKTNSNKHTEESKLSRQCLSRWRTI